MSKFKATQTTLEGLVMIEPTVFSDARGFFMETYSERDFAEIGITEHFVQHNHSKSNRGVLRGMHFQTKHTQGKLIRVAAGSVLDVVIDLRPESSTFGKWEIVELGAENKKQLYVPPRFAHGFLTLEDNTELLYLCSDYYAPEFDAGILWDDPNVGIDWKLKEYGITGLILSGKDKKHPTIDQIDWANLWK